MRPFSALDRRLHRVFKSETNSNLSPASKNVHKINKTNIRMAGPTGSNRRQMVPVEDQVQEANLASSGCSGKQNLSGHGSRKRHQRKKGVTNDTVKNSVDGTNDNGNIQETSGKTLHVSDTNKTRRVSSDNTIRRKEARNAYEAHLISESLIQSSDNQAIVIREVARKKLFRHAKFLTEEMLVVDGEICNFVLSEIGRANDKSKYRYSLWMTIKPVIKQAINTKRTSVSMIIKEKFISK